MISDLLGRLHPLVVHFPIGFLFLAFLFELMSLFRRWRSLRRAVFPALIMGIAAALVAVITGLNFADESETNAAMLLTHKWFGISTVIVAILLSVVMLIGRGFSKSVRAQSRLFLFSVTMISLTLAGHFGGKLAHGEDYWSESSSAPASPGVDSGTVYMTRIRPILEAKCYSCHGNVRQKGGLRLDSEGAITKGGKHGAVLGGEEELLRRINLDPSDKKHMPPKEKTQLTDLEIKVLTGWVNAGASFTDKEAEVREAPGNQVGIPWFPENEPKGEADPNSITKMKATGARVVQLAVVSKWLEINVLPNVVLDQSFWNTWDVLAPFVASARFSRCQLTDAQLKSISKAVNLRRLFLDQTPVGDTGLSSLYSLNQLTYLNLVSTRVTGKGIRGLELMPELRDVYMFGCTVKPEDLNGLMGGKIRIDTGRVSIPILPTDTVEFTKK